MTKLALELPHFGRVDNPPGLSFSGGNANLGAILSSLLNISFYIAIFLCFYFIVWGAFQYILASGNKEDLGKARARITWALMGLIFILFAYFIATYASQIFPSQKGGPF